VVETSDQTVDRLARKGMYIAMMCSVPCFSDVFAHVVVVVVVAAESMQ
jgi:hypothetical protein